MQKELFIHIEVYITGSLGDRTGGQHLCSRMRVRVFARSGPACDVVPA